MRGSVLIAVVLCGCAATAPAPGQPDDARFVCSGQPPIPSVPLRRLSHAEYRNAVLALIASSGLGADDQAAVRGVVEPALEQDPPDAPVPGPGERGGGFVELDQAIEQGRIDASYAVATALASELASTPARRAAVVGPCATDADATNDRACLDSFVSTFGARALRRPLTPDDVDFYEAGALATPTDASALADVLTLLLTAPQLLYLVEETDGSGPLDAYALASRLSFHFWQSPPDDALFEAARSGALLDPNGYPAQVERVAADPRADAAREAFFSQWLRLDALPPLDAHDSDPAFAAFAGADLPGPSLTSDLQREVLDALALSHREDDSLADALLSRRFVARSPALAALYGQTAWDGVSTPADFNDDARSGLFTRAAFLASGGTQTRPVLKGLTLYNALLCQPLSSPPADAPLTPPSPAAGTTTRAALEALTQQSGTSCAGCHTVLNPFGYVTENFDALGRGTSATDTRSELLVGGALHVVANARSATQLMLSSGQVQSCFARQAFRFTYRRFEDDAADGCTLAAVQGDALGGAALATLWKETALQPAFRRKDVR
jgi:hypothetical protein